MADSLKDYKEYLKEVKIKHILLAVEKSKSHIKAMGRGTILIEILLGVIVGAITIYLGVPLIAYAGGACFFVYAMKKNPRNALPATLGFVKFGFISVFPPIALFPIAVFSKKIIPEKVSDKFMDPEDVTAMKSERALKFYAIGNAFKVEMKNMDKFKKAVEDHEKLEAIELPVGIWEKIKAKMGRSERQEAKKQLEKIKKEVQGKIDEVGKEITNQSLRMIHELEIIFKRGVAMGMRLLGTAVGLVGRILCIPLCFLVLLVIAIIIIISYAIMTEDFNYNIFWTLLIVIAGPLMIMASIFLRVAGGAIASVFAFILFDAILIPIVHTTIKVGTKFAEEAAKMCVDAKAAYGGIPDVKPSIDQELTSYYLTFIAGCKDKFITAYKKKVDDLLERGWITEEDRDYLIDQLGGSKKPDKLFKAFKELDKLQQNLQNGIQAPPQAQTVEE
jgi:hypothetical protein